MQYPPISAYFEKKHCLIFLTCLVCQLGLQDVALTFAKFCKNFLNVFNVFIRRVQRPYNNGVTQVTDPWLLRVPALPSFVPFPLAADAYTERMAFSERLWNALTLLDWTVWPRLEHVDDSFVERYVPGQTYGRLAARSLVWLVNTDTVVDYPRPTMPNEVRSQLIFNLPDNLRDWPGTGLASGVYRTINVLEKNSSAICLSNIEVFVFRHACIVCMHRVVTLLSVHSKMSVYPRIFSVASFPYLTEPFPYTRYVCVGVNRRNN